MCRRRGRPIWPAIAILLAGIATLLPWSIYNANRFDESVFLSTNDGSTLLGANCDGSYYREIGGWDLLCLAPLEPVGIGHDPGEPDASERSLARRVTCTRLHQLPRRAASGRDGGTGRQNARRLWPLIVGRSRRRGRQGRVGVLGGHRLVLGAHPARRRGLDGAVTSEGRCADGGSWSPWCRCSSPSSSTTDRIGSAPAAEPTVVLLAAVALVMWWERARSSRPIEEDEPIDSRIIHSGA